LVLQSGAAKAFESIAILVHEKVALTGHANIADLFRRADMCRNSLFRPLERIFGGLRRNNGFTSLRFLLGASVG